MAQEENIERFAIRVIKSRGEEVRRILSNTANLDTSLKIREDGDFLLLPLKASPQNSQSLNKFNKLLDITLLGVGGVDIVTRYFEKMKDRIHGDYKTCLEDLPEEIFPFLPSSFDIVGDLAIIKLQSEVEPFAGRIAAALLGSHPSFKGIFRDLGVKGRFRIRELRHLAGEDRTLTIHREYGMILKVDITRVYFTPRLAWERHRVSQMIGKKERVLDMFAGIGPFSIALARCSPGSEIHAVDQNPEAIKLMMENIELNRISNIIPHQGDARDLAPTLIKERGFDRIIMNLPHSALEFLDTAMDVMKNGTIHIYDIIKREELDKHIRFIKEVVRNKGKSIVVLSSREIKGYSPTEAFVVHDLKVKG